MRYKARSAIIWVVDTNKTNDSFVTQRRPKNEKQILFSFSISKELTVPSSYGA